MVNIPIDETGEYLPVMETFYSIQGEGFHAGKPAFFIRIGGCDVCCHWCDVKESWNAQLYPLISIDNIISQIQKHQVKAVVITGGEPMNFNLTPLTKALKQNSIETFLETSGSCALSGYWDWICLSPKRNQPPLPEYYALANELKVVICNQDDFSWAEENARQLTNNIYKCLQPEWSNRKAMIPQIVAYSLLHPEWNVSLQIHKYMNIP